MANPSGEMPFLEHLEELRGRILKSLIAVFVGVGVALWVVLKFDLIRRISAPIAPYLATAGGRLTVTAPTETFMIYLKLGVVFGLVLASPVVLYQLWGFLSPALYAREKKALTPTLVIGLLLFMIGAWIGWRFVVPMGLRVLMSFQQDAVNPMITFQNYFGFVINVLLAFGVSFELPLVMILLAWLGLVTPQRYNSFRRYAYLLCFVAGAVLSPGTDITGMIVFSVPLLVLYEIGVLGSYVVRRRKRLKEAATAGLVILMFAIIPRGASAQGLPVQAGAGQGTDTTKRGIPPPGSTKIDAKTAKRLGLPTSSTARFPEPDSVMKALMARKGLAATRFLSDSATLQASEQRILLGGHAATLRDRDTLQADRIIYDDANCQLAAQGTPQLFGNSKILIGRDMVFNTCTSRGIITEGVTTFSEMGTWFVRGHLAVDSSGRRLFAAKSEFTSCDLPEPDYHFLAGQVKWVSQSMIVVRPAVLYVRDVPIAWLPFLFQDTKRGRASGILIPQFGFNDIVRPTRGYNRQITNLGYYWAPNDYVDLTTRFDWYSKRSVQYGAEFRYRWLDKFIQEGSGLGISLQRQDDGRSSTQLHWNHNQQFNASTRLILQANYASNSSVVLGNAVDPVLSTQQITSSVQLTKRMRWGQMVLGGTRNQTLTDGSGQMTLPSLSISPRPLQLSHAITWSPAFTVTNITGFKTPLARQTLISNGGFDTLAATGSSRSTTFDIPTPLQIGGFTWQNQIRGNDQRTTGRVVAAVKVPNESTADPNDSLTVMTVTGGTFTSSLDYDTGINLPNLFRSTWKLTPSIGVTNVTPGPLLIRTQNSHGEWVAQGKKLQLGVQAVPTFFAFFNWGLGPVSRLRHKFAPVVNFRWSPEARLSDQYADALGTSAAGTAVSRTVAPTMATTVQLTQTIEAKLRQPAGDSTAAQRNSRPLVVLSLNTSGLSYDFEQAKLFGRTGWTTQAISNTVASDLLPNFSLSLTHDLWDGPVGYDTTRFSPFLSSVQANLSLTGRTFRSLGALIGLGGKDNPVTPATPPVQTTPTGSLLSRYRPGSFAASNVAAGFGSRGFTASLGFSLRRTRTTGNTALPGQPGVGTDPFGNAPLPIPASIGTQSNISLSTSFSPTLAWAVSYSTMYNATSGKFESQSIQLQRDLHDWKASFNFLKSPNGNFALYFSVFLLNLPDVKFDYNQYTVQQQ